MKTKKIKKLSLTKTTVDNLVASMDAVRGGIDIEYTWPRTFGPFEGCEPTLCQEASDCGCYPPCTSFAIPC